MNQPANQAAPLRSHHGHSSHLRAAIALARRRRRALGPAPPPPLGEWLADAVAATVGSWRFILVQSTLILSWIAGNAVFGGGAWDPYPFILLNLLLSFQAAYTAPIIMMSQNRLSDVDRERAMADYQVNIRAEAEIALLHEKIDLMRERELLELTHLLKTALARIDTLESRKATP
ncbi:DUF1003 domain-containing protein [Roseomonas sp. PWR1]|uniref:DUF1003 domain-containing protein n=1 Tax=Roseomonas nitratireducens TaxID=2820810 RepID=A0ABS4AVU6_9PROT|nr:DUF1003 domain-containing protein [Neoroseomonas nitratireducens]MBP0464891.1 DUF1003 domain-containing protein [Neoroseomonas nitratireducens]